MYDENYEEYDPDVYDEFGEGFETDFDAKSEKVYEKAFEESPMLEQEENEEEYEFDEIVGGRDKKPVMSLLNKGKLSKYEMDDLLNGLDE